MSSLNEAIKTVQAAAPPIPPAPVEVTNERTSSLLIYLWDETVWTLAWSHFVCARYRPKVPPSRRSARASDTAQSGSVQSGDGDNAVANSAAEGDTVEQIELTFAHRAVVVQGHNLLSLMETIADMSLCVLREIAQDFTALNAENADAENVEIKSADAESMDADNANADDVEAENGGAEIAESEGVNVPTVAPQAPIVITGIDVQIHEA